MKQKKCKVCLEEYDPFTTTQKACSPKCAIELVKRRQERAFKAETRRMRVKAKGRGTWLKEAQNAFNKYIRIRDARESCISCNRKHAGQYHAGHYRSVGAYPELRFCEDNCHKQCAPCNNHKSGNVVEYRINLRQKIGDDKLEWLEGKHEPKKYTIDQIIDIKKKYTELYKSLCKSLESL